MTALLAIRKALVALLKARFPYAVYFTNNACASAGYFYVELAPKRETFDRVLYEREIAVSLALVMEPDARGRVRRDALYEAAETLDAALLPVFTVGDRAITISEASSRIVDEVLHYSFSLDFADAMPEEPVELMEELSINGEREI